MRFLLALLLSASSSWAAIDLQLPTENDHLFSGNPDKFFMYVDRYFEGDHTQPWEGGAYGYVRTSQRVGDQIIQTKFHEGIDIAPMKRDKAGNPLDLVSAIAEGKVVYVSAVSGRSNYGKYVVIEHNWENTPVLSLYAHLADITCKVGDPIAKGGLIGRMGYTGEGITRVRAHVHLEIALMLSARYPDWAPKTLNYHGLYNGINLAGLDVTGFFLAHKANPSLTISQYLAAYPTYYKVTLPNKGPVELATRYPWLLKTPATQQSASWEISFSDTGMPLSICASDRTVPSAIVTMVKPSSIPHRYKTRGLLSGEGQRAGLARDGQNLLDLLAGYFPAAPVAPTAPPTR
jgi:murein DD-endopeptidase MepM/ murein hydrolase activator NlpD